MHGCQTHRVAQGQRHKMIVYADTIADIPLNFCVVGRAGERLTPDGTDFRRFAAWLRCVQARTLLHVGDEALEIVAVPQRVEIGVTVQ